MNWNAVSCPGGFQSCFFHEPARGLALCQSEIRSQPVIGSNAEDKTFIALKVAQELRQHEFSGVVKTDDWLDLLACCSHYVRIL